MSNTQVRIAFLIMAHEKPEQLLRLVNALDDDRASFHIHLDKKTDASSFQALLGDRKNVHLLPNRVKANWMGFSLVEATLRLLADAAIHGFDYCILLSGSDYPIKSRDELFTFFEKADREYIAYWRIEDRPSWMHKVLFHYPIDAVPIRNYSANRESVYWRRLFWGRFFKYRKYMPKRAFLKNMVPYGGPDWWSLSYACVAHVLKYVDENPGYKKFYKTTNSPGEMFFQTIILNSDWGQRVENRDNYLAWSMARSVQGARSDGAMLPDEDFNYRYVDWSGESSGYRETPAILDERDWEVIRNSRCHFARKFDPERSSVLLDLIDRQILGIA
jgi:hypothetical protein